MKVVVTLVLVALLITATSSVTFAAVDSVDVLIKTLIEKNVITEDDAAAIRAKIAGIHQEEEKKKTFNVSAKRPVKLSGYIQERYTHSDVHGYNDSFETKRARLSLGGDATDRVDFKLQVDFAGSRSAVSSATYAANADPAQAKLSTSNAIFSKPTLLDAVLGYKVTSASKLSIGQFKIPFGLENLTSSYALDTINRSQVTEALVPGRDNGSQGRDIGTQYSGVAAFDKHATKALEYAVGLFNGSGINVQDDNAQKDLAGRLVWRTGAPGLALGYDHYNGSSGIAHTSKIRSDVELVYQLGANILKGEYIWGTLGATHKKGYYATFVRQLSSSTQAVVRFDQLDPNEAVASDKSSTWTFGFNKFLNKDGYTRWQINYQRQREEGTQVPNDQLLAQFQAGF